VTVFHNPKQENGSQQGSEKKVGERFSSNQRKIMELIANDSIISAQQLAEIIGISQRKVEENIAKLKARGRLRRIGPDKGGHWEVRD